MTIQFGTDKCKWDRRLNIVERTRLHQAIEDNKVRQQAARAEFLDALTGGFTPTEVRIDDCIPGLLAP